MWGTLKRNRQRLYYSLLLGEVPTYETDENGNIKYYEDGNGNREPMDTGEPKPFYSTPVEFLGNIALSGGDAVPVEYGLSIESYAAVLLTGKGEVPLVEGALIWHMSEPEYESDGEEITVEIDGEAVKTKAPIKESADYMIVKASPSINVDKYVLSAINK